MRFSFALSPFKMWTFLDIFVELTISKISSYKDLSSLITYTFAFFICFLVIFTSYPAKHTFNTANWDESEIRIPSSYEVDTYIDNLSKDSIVINSFIDNNYLVSFDMLPTVEDRDFNYEHKKLDTHDDMF